MDEVKKENLQEIMCIEGWYLQSDVKYWSHIKLLNVMHETILNNIQQTPLG